MIPSGGGRYQTWQYLANHRQERLNAPPTGVMEGGTPAPSGVSLTGSVGGFFDPAGGALGHGDPSPAPDPMDELSLRPFGVVPGTQQALSMHAGAGRRDAMPTYRGSGAFFDPSGGRFHELRLPEDDQESDLHGSNGRANDGRMCGGPWGGGEECAVSLKAALRPPTPPRARGGAQAGRTRSLSRGIAPSKPGLLQSL